MTLLKLSTKVTNCTTSIYYITIDRTGKTRNRSDTTEKERDDKRTAL